MHLGHRSRLLYSKFVLVFSMVMLLIFRFYVYCNCWWCVLCVCVFFSSFLLSVNGIVYCVFVKRISAHSIAPVCLCSNHMIRVDVTSISLYFLCQTCALILCISVESTPRSTYILYIHKTVFVLGFFFIFFLFGFNSRFSYIHTFAILFI